MKIVKKKRTYPLPVELLSKLEKASNHRQTPQVRIVIKALENYLDGDGFKEISK